MKKSRTFSFLCDCGQFSIVWIKRFHLDEYGNIHLEGICLSCGKSYPRLVITTEDMAKLTAEAIDSDAYEAGLTPFEA